ncbi:peptidoglycan recognition family protein [Kribbella sp. NPDC051718]|uniref:peptidoglycan recognition protein family protein n=1 Tax=Kribbella sp. NPDC051718 TaxID=3155168 RepID=UPI003413E0A1
MVDYLPRSAWGARAAKSGPGDLTLSRVVGTAVHWPGTESSKPISKTGVASALRGWQAYHMDPEPGGRGWSDIAYQVAVDQWGRAWTLRGLRTQSGANGDNSVNETYGAVLLVLVQGEEPTEAMKATVREVMADYDRLYPNWAHVVGHGDIRPHGGTDCPGPAAKAALKRGEFFPRPSTPTPTTPEDNMANWTEDELRKINREEQEKYAKRFWTDPTGTGTALIKKVEALGNGLVAIGAQLTAEDKADDAALSAAVAELKAAIAAEVPAPPKA